MFSFFLALHSFSESDLGIKVVRVRDGWDCCNETHEVYAKVFLGKRISQTWNYRTSYRLGRISMEWWKEKNLKNREPLTYESIPTPQDSRLKTLNLSLLHIIGSLWSSKKNQRTLNNKRARCRHFKYLFYTDYQTIKSTLDAAICCTLAVCLQLSVFAMLKQRLQVEIDVLFCLFFRMCSYYPSLHITRLWFWHHSWTKSMFHTNYDFLHRLSCVSPKTHSCSFSCARLETAEFSTEYGVFTLIYLLYLLPDDSNQMKSSFHFRIHWTICWLFSGDMWCFQRNKRTKRMYKKPAQISNNNLCKFFSVVPPCRFRLCASWQKRRKFALQHSVFIFRLPNVPFSLMCFMRPPFVKREKLIEEVEKVGREILNWNRSLVVVGKLSALRGVLTQRRRLLYTFFYTPGKREEGGKSRWWMGKFFRVLLFEIIVKRGKKMNWIRKLNATARNTPLLMLIRVNIQFARGGEFEILKL